MANLDSLGSHLTLLKCTEIRTFLSLRQLAFCTLMTIVDYTHGGGVTKNRTYSTEEAAEVLGISKSTILRWFKQGRIEEVRRDRNGWRVFTQADLTAIRKKVG